MKAMILAAGVGSRLDPLTRNLPKPLVPIVNRPVMEHIVYMLRDHGIVDIVVNLHYLGEQIEAYFGDGSRFGVNLHYQREEQLWGDAGSVKRAEDILKDDTFIVVGGDDLSDMDIGRLLKAHKDKKALATIGLSLVDDPSQYGIVLLNEEGRVTRFLEKPKGEVIFSNMANTGFYVFEPEVFDLIPRGTFYLLGRTLFPLLLQQQRPVYGHLTASYWRDVGDLAAYRSAHLDALADRVRIKFPVPQQRKFVWIGENVEIDSTAEIGYPVVIGDNCKIGPGARVLENTIIGQGCEVESGAVVKESILWDGAVVLEGTWLERCVVGSNCHVRTNVAVFDGLIVSPQRPAGR